MSPYICPICQQALNAHSSSKGYYCANKHHFDLAKEGYLNLLPVQHKKSKQPGDSRAMMRSRRNFLEAGFYQPMAEAIAAMIERHRNDITRLLDIGCGEGYFSRQIEQHCQQPEKLELHGVDIAKNAILAAAKKQANARFIVASNKLLPYANEYFDLLLRVYAPSNDQEISRLLKPNGLLLTVTPGPRHLWQLRQFIYPTIKEHPLDIQTPNGFEQIEQQRLQFTIQPNTEQRMALLQMTPFGWRAKGEKLSNIQRAHELEIEADFVLTISLKQHNA